MFNAGKQFIPDAPPILVVYIIQLQLSEVQGAQHFLQQLYTFLSQRVAF
jgi:hypothetical protein